MTTQKMTLPFPITPEIKLLRTFFKLANPIAPQLTQKLALRLFLTPTRRKPSKKATHLFAQAETVKVMHGSREITVYSWGRGEKTILLVHGWGSDASGMRNFVTPLLDRGFRVVAFDAPAHGRSSGNQTNFIDYTGTIISIAERFGPLYGVIGHSFGAATAVYTLSTNPQLNVKRAVILSPPAQLAEMIEIWTEALLLPRSLYEGMTRRIVDRVGIPIQSLNLDKFAANLTIPGLVVHDKDDLNVPFKNGVAIANAWKECRFIETERLGHRGVLRSELVIDEVVAFLS